jgi:hypothetical protein
LVKQYKHLFNMANVDRMSDLPSLEGIERVVISQAAVDVLPLCIYANSTGEASASACMDWKPTQHRNGDSYRSRCILHRELSIQRGGVLQ